MRLFTVSKDYLRQPCFRLLFYSCFPYDTVRKKTVHSMFWITNTKKLTRAWIFIFFTMEIEAKTRKNLRNFKNT